MTPQPSLEVAALLRAILALSRRMRAERGESGVSLSALSLLGCLHRAGPMTAAELAAAERLKPQSVTRLIAGLEREGLIERRQSRTDGRERLLILTKVGRARLLRDIGSRQSWLEAAFAGALTAEEQAALIAATGAMRRLADYDVRRDDDGRLD